jgi:hypothetical protein
MVTEYLEHTPVLDSVSESLEADLAAMFLLISNYT